MVPMWHSVWHSMWLYEVAPKNAVFWEEADGIDRWMDRNKEGRIDADTMTVFESRHADRVKE